MKINKSNSHQDEMFIIRKSLMMDVPDASFLVWHACMQVGYMIA
jgi:hypothetical protein